MKVRFIESFRLQTGPKVAKCNYGVKGAFVLSFFVRSFLLCPGVYFPSKQTPANMRDAKLTPTQQSFCQIF